MSNRLAMILPNNLSDDIFEEIRKKYNFDLIPSQNQSLKSVLKNNESILYLHMYGEETGITRYYQYISHFTNIEELIDVWGFDIYYRTITSINQRWLNDANNWVNIIKDIKNEHNVATIGLISLYAEDVIDNVVFKIKERREIETSKMNALTLMKCKTGIIYTFI